MSRTRILLFSGLGLFVFATGCQSNVSAPIGKTAPTAHTSSHGGTAGLDELQPDDRKIAVEQKNCPVSGEPLGSMGAPIKLTLNGTPVFVCCDGCTRRAENHPTDTLKKVQESKSKK